MKEWPLQAEREFWADACSPGTSEDSLWWFTRIAWGTEWYFTRTGKTRWLVARVHKPFLRWLSRHIQEWKAWRARGVQEQKILLVLFPRDTGKTVLGTKCSQLWTHLNDPNLSSYTGSETHSKAKSFLSAIKGLISGDSADTDAYGWFTWLYGNWKHSERTWKQEEVRDAYRQSTGFSEPSFGTWGLDMGITGYHPDALFFDDPNSQETLTEKTLSDARESYESTTHNALRKDGLFVGSMTRYAGNDCPGHIMALEGVASWSGIPNPDPRALPPRPGGRVHVYFLQGRDSSNKTEEYPKGVPVFPEIYTEETLTFRETANPVDYANQIQNNPTVGEHMPLEYAQLERMLVSRDDLPAIDFATLHLDCAFKDEKRVEKGDYNVILGALHALNDRITRRVFIDRIIRDKKSRSEQFISKIVAYLMSLRARGIRVKVITDEMGQGGHTDSFKQLLTLSLNMAGFRIGPDSILLFNRTNRKEIRLRKAAAYWVEGFVGIIKGIEFEDRLMYEMVNLDKGDHDDICDAASDIWHPGVWRPPVTGSDPIGSDPVQPGDEVLRPHYGVTEILNNREARIRRLAEINPALRGESEYRDDPV